MSGHEHGFEYCWTYDYLSMEGSLRSDGAGKFSDQMIPEIMG